VRRAAAACAVAVAALGLAVVPVARAAAPSGDGLRLADARAIPIEYFQGLTHDRAGARYFDGVTVGLYRTGRSLRETARVANAIPPAVSAAFGFNHIGDLTWDAAEGGRLILPLECFTPGAPNGGNTCGQGGFGVADPVTLGWRYLVPLDPVDIAKAMWAEVSPDGAFVWTSSGPDLLAYRTADVSAANAATGVRIRPAVRVRAGSMTVRRPPRRRRARSLPGKSAAVARDPLDTIGLAPMITRWSVRSISGTVKATGLPNR